MKSVMLSILLLFVFAFSSEITPVGGWAAGAGDCNRPPNEDPSTYEKQCNDEVISPILYNECFYACLPYSPTGITYAPAFNRLAPIEPYTDLPSYVNVHVRAFDINGEAIGLSDIDESFTLNGITSSNFVYTLNGGQPIYFNDSMEFILHPTSNNSPFTIQYIILDPNTPLNDDESQPPTAHFTHLLHTEPCSTFLPCKSSMALPVTPTEAKKSEEPISLYPTMAQNQIVLTSNILQKQNLDLIITSSYGKQVLRRNLVRGEVTQYVDISRLKKGLYYARLNGEGYLKTIKFYKID